MHMHTETHKRRGIFLINRHHFLSNIHPLLEEEEKSNQTVSWAEALVGEVVKSFLLMDSLHLLP